MDNSNNYKINNENLQINDTKQRNNIITEDEAINLIKGWNDEIKNVLKRHHNIQSIDDTQNEENQNTLFHLQNSKQSKEKKLKEIYNSIFYKITHFFAFIGKFFDKLFFDKKIHKLKEEISNLGEQIKTNPEHIKQPIKDLYYKIYFSISGRRSDKYIGISPYKIQIGNTNLSCILQFFENKINSKNDKNKQIFSEFLENYRLLENTANQFIEKNDILDPDESIPMDASIRTKTRLAEAEENKKNLNVFFDENGNRVNYNRSKKVRQANQELKNPTHPNDKQNKLKLNDEISQSEITNIPVGEISDNLNLEKKPQKGILNKDAPKTP